MSGVERAYRALLVAYPRSMRRSHGEEMIALVRDRHVLDGEPWWRLWPSVTLDTLRCAPTARAEDVARRHRPLLLGALGAVAGLAVLSEGVPASIPLLALLAGLAAGVTRWRADAAGAVPRARSWSRWTSVGATLLTLGVGTSAVVPRDLAVAEWMVVFTAIVVGLFACATGLALAVTGRRRASAA